MSEPPKIVGLAYEVESRDADGNSTSVWFATDEEAYTYQEELDRKGIPSQKYWYRMIRQPDGWRSGLSNTDRPLYRSDATRTIEEAKDDITF